MHLIFAPQGLLQWSLSKEPIDFTHLHEKLYSQCAEDMSSIPRALLPPLQERTSSFFGSSIFSGFRTTSSTSITGLLASSTRNHLSGQKGQKLSSSKSDMKTSTAPVTLSTEARYACYLQALLQLPQSLSNQHILSFLGICNTSRADDVPMSVKESDSSALPQVLIKKSIILTQY